MPRTRSESVPPAVVAHSDLRHWNLRPLRTETPLSVHAEFRGPPIELRIPRSALPAYDQLWAKCERRFGFFDEAGWFELEHQEGSVVGGEATREREASQSLD